ncbi:MAG TPA: GyrI-like domain-containing protein [Xanthobacteraceae bacterium]|nr:GyrI-like domain-containing protein [Xanthobacteraceae bacterium]
MTASTETRPGEFQIVTTQRQTVAIVRNNVAFGEIAQVQHSSRAKIAAALKTIDAGAQGAALTMWSRRGEGRMQLDPGVTVERVFAPAGDVVAAELPGGRAAFYRLVGPYEQLPQAWDKLIGWCDARELKRADVNWEVYETASGPTGQPETGLYMLLA